MYDMRVAMIIVGGVADSGLALIRDVFAAANLLADQIDPHIERSTVVTNVIGSQDQIRTAYGLPVTAQPMPGRS